MRFDSQTALSLLYNYCYPKWRLIQVYIRDWKKTSCGVMKSIQDSVFDVLVVGVDYGAGMNTARKTPKTAGSNKQYWCIRTTLDWTLLTYIESERPEALAHKKKRQIIFPENHWNLVNEARFLALNKPDWPVNTTKKLTTFWTWVGTTKPGVWFSGSNCHVAALPLPPSSTSEIT